MNFEMDLIDILKKFRDDLISNDELKIWFSNNENRINSLIRKPGVRLKIKHGDKKTITSIIGQYSKTVACDTIFNEGLFTDLNDFERCDRAITDALAKGLLKKISEPVWFKPPPGEMGAAVFYECLDTGSIWNLVIPERASRGYWKKIA